ncbi:MAG: ABC transporter permease [Candidatus Izemoplasmatales bacterium]
MADMNKKELNIDKSQFEFVQQKQKIYDKKFETKPIGYFKDAMIRFSKNRTNLTASIILGVLILLSIFLPILSSKNAETLQETLSYLPPRIPVLEHLGIADGTGSRYDQPVDLSTIDPETGLGLPFSTQVKYIHMDTLENYYKGCTEKDDQCFGGQIELRIDNNKTGVEVISNQWIAISQENNPVLEINVNSIPTDVQGKITVLVGPIGSEYREVGVITDSGVHTFDLFDIHSDLPNSIKVKLRYESSDVLKVVSFNSVGIISDDAEDKYSYYVDGYEFSQYKLVSSTDYSGAILRANGQRLMSSFKYDAYAERFGDKFMIMGGVEYNRLLAEYGDTCTISPDPDNANGWLFSEGCPMVRVIQKNSDYVVVGGEKLYTYQVIINFQIYEDYDEIPYFWFGTSAAGKDMLKLIFIGLRTSLSIGLLVAIINITIGIIYGAISGYYGGQVDIIMERFAEIIGRIPWLVTLSIFIALIGPGIKTLIYVMVVSGWIGVASVTRTQFYRYKGREYVLASRTLGAKDGRLIFRHILPNGLGTIITSSILMVPSLIFTEATLSYLGFGIGHGQSFNILGIPMSGVSIGVLLADGRNQLRQNPHLTLFPAIVISILMITFNMFGNALRDAFNPALRGSE